MAITQIRSKRKPTGGRYTGRPAKLRARKGSRPTLTRIGARRPKQVRTRGGDAKLRLLSAQKVNLYDPATKKHEVVEMTTITESPANRHFVRRNIITKGSLIQTPKGVARVRSRPGQQGSIDAVLVQ